MEPSYTDFDTIELMFQRVISSLLRGVPCVKNVLCILFTKYVTVCNGRFLGVWHRSVSIGTVS
jgi:hypothetical protein